MFCNVSKSNIIRSEYISEYKCGNPSKYVGLTLKLSKLFNMVLLGSKIRLCKSCSRKNNLIKSICVQHSRSRRQCLLPPSQVLNPRHFAQLGYFTMKDGFAKTTVKFKQISCSFCQSNSGCQIKKTVMFALSFKHQTLEEHFRNSHHANPEMITKRPRYELTSHQTSPSPIIVDIQKSIYGVVYIYYSLHICIQFSLYTAQYIQYWVVYIGKNRYTVQYRIVSQYRVSYVI